MAFAFVNNSGFGNGTPSFAALDRIQLLEIFQFSLENATTLKYPNYQLDFYLKGNLIDKLEVKFVFPDSIKQAEFISFKVEVEENLCINRNPYIWIDFSKLITAQKRECNVQFSFSGESSQAAKMIDQKIVVDFLEVAGRFFDAKRVKGVSFLNSTFDNLKLT